MFSIIDKVGFFYVPSSFFKISFFFQVLCSPSRAWPRGFLPTLLDSSLRLSTPPGLANYGGQARALEDVEEKKRF